MKKLIVYTDGASRGNPGLASYGFAIFDENKNLLFEKGEYIGITTNNVAEYTAVLESLNKIKEQFKSELPIEISYFADSKLVVEQLSGRYKIKSPHLKEIIIQIRILQKEIGDTTFNHVLRDKNKHADRLANEALDRI